MSSAATDCFTEVSADSDWIRPAPLDRRLFTYDPNTTGRPRTATFMLAGQAYPITQEASAPRAPLLVEPSEAFGMRSVFRVTYADGALTSPLTTSLIEFGDRCSFTFQRVQRRFVARNEYCTLNAWQVGEPAGLLILTLDISFADRTDLPIRADGRHLGVMHAGQDAPPLTLVKPVEIPSSWRGAIGLWTDSRVGIGGTFRFGLQPPGGASAAPPAGATIYFKDKPGLAPHRSACGLFVDIEARTIALRDDLDISSSSPAVAGASVSLANSQCIVDMAKASIQTRGSLAIVDVPVLFRSAWLGFRSIAATFSVRNGHTFPLEDVADFSVTPSVGQPSAFTLPGLLRISLPAQVPIDTARVMIAPSVDSTSGCLLQYDSPTSSLRASGLCALGTSTFQMIDNALVLILNPAYDSLLRGGQTVFASQTPQGGADSGWFRIGGISLQ